MKVDGFDAKSGTRSDCECIKGSKWDKTDAIAVLMNTGSNMPENLKFTQTKANLISVILFGVRPTQYLDNVW